MVFMVWFQGKINIENLAALSPATCAKGATIKRLHNGILKCL